MSAGGLAAAWSRELIGGLLRSGVERVFISPGSRSTPLALAAFDLAPSECAVVIDERAAAFAALGQARVSGRPSAVIATSGSAPAHWFPAVIEADLANVPLVLVSADRPIELQEAGASQTIDQVRLFGGHVRKSFELGAPDELALPRLGEVALRAACAAVAPRPGPVHVNARFRKPLEPSDAPPLALPARQPAVLFPGTLAPSPAAVRFVAEALERAERPLLVLGAGPYSAAPRAEHVRRLREATRAVRQRWSVAVLAEHTSGLTPDPEGAVLGLGPLLLGGALEGDGAPDVLLELGSHPFSGAYSAVAERASLRVVVGAEGAHDPLGNARAVVLADSCAFLEELSRLGPGPDARAPRASYAGALERASARVLSAVRGELARAPLDGPLDEPRAVATVAAALPAGAVVAVGNSLVVRELEAYGAHELTAPLVLHQRGAAGIDGLIAGAFGARLAADRERAVALLLGDVSALHDVGSFALLASVRAPLVVVVIDNGGGRIFEELPVRAALEGSTTFEQLYLTPPPPGFLEHTARAYGLAFEAVLSAAALREAMARAAAAPQATVLHVVVEPARSSERKRAIRLAASGALRHEAGDG